MFDTINKWPNQVKVDVTQKRAPTDESVRILAEMQEKAMQSVLNWHTDKLQIDQVGIMTTKDIWGMSATVSMHVDGRPVSKSVRFDMRDIVSRSPDEACGQVGDKLVKCASELFAESIQKELFAKAGVKIANEVFRATK